MYYSLYYMLTLNSIGCIADDKLIILHVIAQSGNQYSLVIVDYENGEIVYHVHILLAENNQRNLPSITDLGLLTT